MDPYPYASIQFTYNSNSIAKKYLQVKSLTLLGKWVVGVPKKCPTLVGSRYALLFVKSEATSKAVALPNTRAQAKTGPFHSSSQTLAAGKLLVAGS